MKLVPIKHIFKSIETDQLYKKVIICYHANCTDGFMAAAAAYSSIYSKAGINNVSVLPIHYNKALPFVSSLHLGAEVMFVDFCPEESVLDELIFGKSFLSKVTVYDHHIGRSDVIKSIIEKYKDKPTRVKLDIIFDTSRSGAMITYDEMKPDGIPLEFFTLAQDYDLWNHNGVSMCDVTYFATCIYSFIQNNSELMNEARKQTGYYVGLQLYTDAFLLIFNKLKLPLSYILSTGKSVAIEKQLEIEALLPFAVTENLTEEEGFDFTMVSCGSQYTSGFSAFIASNNPNSVVTLCHSVRDGKLLFGLRAGAKKLLSLHKLASIIEPTGGGHRDAAGVLTSKSLTDVIEIVKTYAALEITTNRKLDTLETDE